MLEKTTIPVPHLNKEQTPIFPVLEHIDLIINPVDGRKIAVMMDVLSGEVYAAADVSDDESADNIARIEDAMNIQMNALRKQNPQLQKREITFVILNLTQQKAQELVGY